MLEYTTIDNPRPSFGLIVHHTDAVREYAYDKAPKSSGKLVEALADAPKRGWTVVDMKRDWNEVFSDKSVTAIDVLLEPDDVMQAQSQEVNAQLRRVFPDSFPIYCLACSSNTSAGQNAKRGGTSLRNLLSPCTQVAPT
jgi:hypothetical protein